MGTALADGDDLEGPQGLSHVEINRAYWSRQAPRYAESAERAWRAEPNWGVWAIPDAQLGLLPDVTGLDVVELGCGTAYFSGWLARRGARCVGVDVTPPQLETARRMQAERGVEFPLVEASAEQVPLPDASFDLALSEYGASIWCDPYRWIPEAARLLRPGGELLFLRNATIFVLASEPDGATGRDLVADYFGMHRFEWPDEDDKSVEFHLGYGDWIRLLRGNGLELEALVELQAPEGAAYPAGLLVTAEWVRHWPTEEIWKARKRS
jgi:SAM-dependent methyltransferase